jgi:hypothetical protein
MNATAFRLDIEFLLFPVDSIPTWGTYLLRSAGIARFLATTKQCAPERCVGSFARVGLPLDPFPLPSPTRLLAPQYQESVFKYAFPLMLGEVAIALWVLIMGAKSPAPAQKS